MVRDSKHLFVNLTKLQPLNDEWFRKASQEGVRQAIDAWMNGNAHNSAFPNIGKWSANGIAITESWLKQGLEPRCITRDLKWGTPVPGTYREGYENKVFYVWYDAPIG